jgi:hypothetical protein
MKSFMGLWFNPVERLPCTREAAGSKYINLNVVFESPAGSIYFMDIKKNN